MNKIKKTIILSGCFVFLSFFSVFIISSQASNRNTDSMINAFNESPFRSQGEIEVQIDELHSRNYPDLTPIGDDGQYIFWYNERGKLEMISPKNESDILFFDVMFDEYDKASVASDARKYFDYIFAEEESLLGTNKETVVSDFSGGDYTATINLLYHGRETGNTASLSFTSKGQLISAVFIHSELSIEQLEADLKVDNVYAEEYAKMEFADMIAEKTLFKAPFEIDVKFSRYRVFRGVRFWEIHLDTQVESGYNIYGVVRIDADSGECLEVSSSIQ